MEHLRCINFYHCMKIGDMIMYITTAHRMYMMIIEKHADIREYAVLAFDCYNDRRRKAASEDTFVCRVIRR